MNKRKTLSCGIDIAAPGGIEALLNFHRKTFGDATMTAGPGEPTPPPNPADPPANPPADPPKPTPPGQPTPKADDLDDIPGLGDAGKRAIRREREAAAQAARDRDELQRQLDEKNRAEMSDLEKARDDAAKEKREAEKLRVENLRLKAIATHSIPVDYQDLVHGTDEASFTASAEKVARLAASAAGTTPPPPPANPRQGVVPESGSGSGSGGGNNATSTVSAGRERYLQKHGKK